MWLLLSFKIVCVSVCTCKPLVYACIGRPEEDVRYLLAEVTEGCELPYVGARNQPQVP